MLLTEGMDNEEVLSAIADECHRRRLSVMVNMNVILCKKKRKQAIFSSDSTIEAIIVPSFDSCRIERCHFYGESIGIWEKIKTWFFNHVVDPNPMASELHWGARYGVGKKNV